MIILFFYRTSITAMLLCLFCFNTSAQDVYSNSESSAFSFTFGMTSSNLINDSVKYKAGILFNAGFVYAVVLTDKLNVALEAQYAGKAFRNESPAVKYRYFYIDVPLYLQYKLSDNIRFNLGAQYSTFTNSKIVVIDPSSNSGVNVKEYTSIKDADYGFLGGAELDLSENFTLAARYTISGSTFFEKNNVNFGVFQLSFKYTVYRSYKQFFHRQKQKE